MNAKYKRVPTQFAPETRFEVKPLPVAPFRALQENRFEQLKNRLLRERLNEGFNSRWHSHFRRAANEAAALAWLTTYPLLVFPSLFEEKAEAVLAQAQFQRAVRQRSRLLTVL